MKKLLVWCCSFLGVLSLSLGLVCYSQSQHIEKVSNQLDYSTEYCEILAEQVGYLSQDVEALTTEVSYLRYSQSQRDTLCIAQGVLDDQNFKVIASLLDSCPEYGRYDIASALYNYARVNETTVDVAIVEGKLLDYVIDNPSEEALEIAGEVVYNRGGSVPKEVCFVTTDYYPALECYKDYGDMRLYIR